MEVTPLVSVVIPAYNSEKTLDTCIKSVTTQSYSNLEIIVVNDGSSDDSKSIIEGYVIRDPRIVLIDKSANEGLVQARYAGVEVASGKYIQYLDSDDILREGAIEHLVKKAEETNADIVVAPFFYCGDGTLQKSLFFIFDELSGIDYLRNVMMWKAHWCVWSKFHLRSLYQNPIERPDISLGEDVILSTQLLFYARKVVPIYQEVVDYNFTSSSMSHSDNFDDVKYEDFKGYVKWFNDFMRTKRLVDVLKKEIAFFHLKAVQTQFGWRKIEDVDKEMRNLIANIKLYPEFSKALTRRERRLVALYRFSHWLGYQKLKSYRRKK